MLVWGTHAPLSLLFLYGDPTSLHLRNETRQLNHPPPCLQLCDSPFPLILGARRAPPTDLSIHLLLATALHLRGHSTNHIHSTHHTGGAQTCEQQQHTAAWPGNTIHSAHLSSPLTWHAGLETQSVACLFLILLVPAASSKTDGVWIFAHASSSEPPRVRVRRGRMDASAQSLRAHVCKNSPFLANCSSFGRPLLAYRLSKLCIRPMRQSHHHESPTRSAGGAAKP